eukprot:s1392_g4.t1
MKLYGTFAPLLLSIAESAQDEPYKNLSYKLVCYTAETVLLQQDTAPDSVSCVNRTLALQNGSSNTFVGSLACYGKVWCPGGGDDNPQLNRLRTTSSLITYVGGGGILLTWLCCSLLGLSRAQSWI